MGLPTPGEAAKSLAIRPTGPRCWVCRTAEAKKWIDEYLDTLESGGPRVSQTTISGLFREHLGMQLISDASVGKHLRQHTEGRWNKLFHG